MLFCGAAQPAQVVNVEYIHNVIAQKWDISVPYNSELTNPRVAANMKYLLTAIDVANEMLNGEKTTDYGTSEYATTVAADTVATDTAVDGLIKKEEKYKFAATIDLSLYEDNIMMGFGVAVTEFGFVLNVAGTFYVDWGDGTTETIKKNNTDAVLYTHDYGTDNGTYIVQIGGLATDYSDDEMTSAIDFSMLVGFNSFYTQAITEIYGSLGAIFPTLSDGSQPRFISLFCYAGELKEIPSGLFDGIHGTAVSNMFNSAFCYTNIHSIPDNLFAGVTGVATGMFKDAFAGTHTLTGPSARINGRYLYEIWPDATRDQVGSMYLGCEGLDDWDSIPEVWK